MILRKMLVFCFLMMSAFLSFAEESLYTIPLQWQDETGTSIKLSRYEGRFVVLTMIYTTCQSACPLIMKKLRTIQSDLGDFKEVEFVIVTFDPSVDTPQALLSYKKAQKIDHSNWHFLNGTEENTRKLSLLLDIGYQKNKQTGHFMHDNKILLLDPKGKILVTLDGLDVDSAPLLKAMGKTPKPSLFKKIKQFLEF